MSLLCLFLFNLDVLLHSQMPAQPTNYDNDEMVQYLLRTLTQITSNPKGKLLNATETTAAALRLGKPEHEVEGSTVKYNYDREQFMNRAIDPFTLPTFPTLYQHSRGDPVPFAQHGLYRSASGEHKPVLVKNDTMALILSDQRYSRLIRSFRLLAQEINKDYCGPSEARLHQIVVAAQAADSNGNGNENVVVPPSRGTQVRRHVRFASDTELTVSRRAEIFTQYLESTDLAYNSLANIVSSD